MSHFSTVKTELRQLEPLVQALEDLGYSPAEGERPVRGYRGQTVTADLAVAVQRAGILVFAGMKRPLPTNWSLILISGNSRSLWNVSWLSSPSATPSTLFWPRQRRRVFKSLSRPSLKTVQSSLSLPAGTPELADLPKPLRHLPRPRSDHRTRPLLGDEFRGQAIKVDEAVCIGCRYCAHVATNTFVVEPRLGRSRAIRQDGDSTERILEAIDTCPVDCILGAVRISGTAEAGPHSPESSGTAPGVMASLPTRRFGRTELQIPLLSLGGMRFQQSWTDLPAEQIAPDAQALLEATLQRAVDEGFHHVETARHYGSSERQLGWALPRSPDPQRILQTKVPPRPDVAAFEQELELSFQRLTVTGWICSLCMASTCRSTLSNSPARGCMEVARRYQAEGHRSCASNSWTHGSLPRPVDRCLRLRESALVLHPPEMARLWMQHGGMHGFSLSVRQIRVGISTVLLHGCWSFVPCFIRSCSTICFASMIQGCTRSALVQLGRRISIFTSSVVNDLMRRR